MQEGSVDISAENGNQMLINAPEGSIGTVTLMQPDSSMGNLSYVLIVQQPGGSDKEVIDESNKALLDEEQSRIYEFDENEEGNEIETVVIKTYKISLFRFIKKKD